MKICSKTSWSLFRWKALVFGTYDAALAITGAIRGTSKEKLCQELGFESLKDRRWLRQLCYLHKIVITKQAAFLYDLIPPFQRSSRNKAVSFKNWFLPYAKEEWNKLDSEIRNAKTKASFRKMLLNFIRPIGNSTYKIYDPLAIKLLKAHWQISKKRCFKKYCSCDQAGQFLAL